MRTLERLASEIGSDCALFLREAPVVMRGRGEQLVMAPPLIITEAEIDDLLGRFARALDETATFVASLP